MGVNSDVTAALALDAFLQTDRRTDRQRASHKDPRHGNVKLNDSLFQCSSGYSPSRAPPHPYYSWGKGVGGMGCVWGGGVGVRGWVGGLGLNGCQEDRTRTIESWYMGTFRGKQLVF